MTWVQASTWTPEVVEQVLALHDLDEGIVVVPAPPRCHSERGALLALLSGLGKDVASHGAPKGGRDTREVAQAWFAGEQVQTVVLLSAQRWRTPEILTAADALGECRAELIPVMTAVPSATQLNLMQDRWGERSTLDAFRLPRVAGTARRTLDPRLAPLRSYRLPHIPALAAGAHAGIPAEVLIELPQAAHQGHEDAVTTPQGRIQLPSGAGRFLHAQKALSATHRSPLLFSLYGRPLRLADASLASMRILADHNLLLPAPAA